MATSSDTLPAEKAAVKADLPFKTGPLDIVRDRWIYLGISLLLLIPGMFYIITNWMNPEINAPVRLGIDFSGGTMLEYGFHNKVTETDLPKIKEVFESRGYHGTVVQIQKPRVGINDEETLQAQKTAKSATAKTEVSADSTPSTPKAAMPVETQKVDSAEKPVTDKPTVETNTEKVAPTNVETTSEESAPEKAAAVEDKAAAASVVAKEEAPSPNALTKPGVKEITPIEATAAVNESSKDAKIATIVYIRSKQLSEADRASIHETLRKDFGSNTLLQNYSIGPSLAEELLQNGILALGLAYLLIVGYLTFRFEFDYALCAIVSLVHDAVFLFGVFAVLGHFFNTEIDSMFITALLTVIGFSVHDTIVVYDRLRENTKVYYTKKLPFSTIANLSVNQTLSRSISTSLTVLLTLLALYLFGGDTTKDFVFACLIGIAAGTYSSIFVASALLTWVRERRQKAA